MAMRSGRMGCSLEQTNLPKFWLQKQETLLLRSKSIQNYNTLPLQTHLPSIIGSEMLIEMDKYQPNSLRKGRRDAFEKDLHDAFTMFSYKYTDPRLLTINDFSDFWKASQLCFIVCLRCQDEEEQEYFQCLYRILINDYFIKGNDSKKIYSVLSMYFLAYSIDVNGDRNPRYIHVTQEFILSLTAFLRINTDFSKHFFVKVIKKIKELFFYSIKTGVRNPLVKKNGETFVRYPKVMKKISKDNFSPTIMQIKESLPELQETIKNYHQAKESFINELDSEDILALKKQMTFDKNISLRLGQILKSYEADITYMEEEVRNGEEAGE